MTEKDPRVERALQYIARCNDPEKLKAMIENAGNAGEYEVRRAAELRLYKVLPAAQPGTLAHDVWQSIYALEGALKDERGKTVLLSRTRQKIKKDGEHKTVSDLVLGKISDGFTMLLDRDMPRLTFEAVALRYAAEFDANVVAAAEARLLERGVDPTLAEGKDVKDYEQPVLLDDTD